METQKLLDLVTEVRVLKDYDRMTAWSYIAGLLASCLSLSGEEAVMEHLKYVRTQKAIEDAKEKN